MPPGSGGTARPRVDAPFIHHSAGRAPCGVGRFVNRETERTGIPPSRRGSRTPAAAHVNEAAGFPAMVTRSSAFGRFPCHRSGFPEQWDSPLAVPSQRNSPGLSRNGLSPRPTCPSGSLCSRRVRTSKQSVQRRLCLCTGTAVQTLQGNSTALWPLHQTKQETSRKPFLSVHAPSHRIRGRMAQLSAPKPPEPQETDINTGTLTGLNESPKPGTNNLD